MCVYVLNYVLLRACVYVRVAEFILSDLYVCVHAWEPLHLNAHAWLDILVLFA